MSLILNPHRYGAATPALPVQLGASGWWRTDNLGLNDNDPISTIVDGSGNNRNLTAATVARAAYKPAVKNGLAVARHDGTDDAFTGTTLSSFLTAAAHTTYAVFSYTSVNSDSVNPYDNDAVYGDLAGNWGLSLRSTGLPLRAFGAGGTSNASRTIALGTWYISEYRHEAGSIYHSINGGAEASAVQGNDTITSTLRVGRTNNGASFFNGDWGEIITFPTALSSVDRQAVRDYLSTKWAI